jgi:hypothetical protein
MCNKHIDHDGNNNNNNEYVDMARHRPAGFCIKALSAKLPAVSSVLAWPSSRGNQTRGVLARRSNVQWC